MVADVHIPLGLRTKRKLASVFDSFELLQRGGK